MSRRRSRDNLGRPLDVWEPTPTTEAAALDPVAALRAAQDRLDAGRPFDAHEVLEAVWKATPADQRDLWQGLAQLTVGVTHALRGNDVGASALLKRGAATLSPYAGTSPHHIDVDGLRRWATAAAAQLTLAATPPRLTTSGR